MIYRKFMNGCVHMMIKSEDQIDKLLNKFKIYEGYFLDEDNEKYEITENILMKLSDGEMVKIRPM